MKRKLTLTLGLALIVFCCPKCFGQTAANIITREGTFTNTQMNENFQSLINSCSPEEEFRVLQNSNNSTDAVTGCLRVPDVSTVWNANALAGYGNNSSTTTNAVGVYASMRCLVSGSSCWGSNPTATDAAGTSAALIIGEEVDIGVKGTPRRVNAIQIAGSLTGKLPASSPAIWLSTTGARWSDGFYTSAGTALYGVHLGPIATGKGQQSSILRLDGTSGSGKDVNSFVFTDSNGSLELKPYLNLNLAAGDFAFTKGAGQHILTASANNDTSGQLRVSSATSASYTFVTVWSAPPACALTPTSDPTAIGAWWVTTSTSTLTANLHTRGTITFNYVCVGNPN
jgi:hypothetical protein